MHQVHSLKILLISLIGLRINEVLNIQRENITVLPDSIEIRFIEGKRSRERTIVVVDKEAMELIKKRLSNNVNLWHFTTYDNFNLLLKKIAKRVFKEETVKLYKINSAKDGYVDVKKCDAISSHAIRRYAIQRNIVKYGIDAARALSGHSDYQTITRREHFQKGLVLKFGVEI